MGLGKLKKRMHNWVAKNYVRSKHPDFFKNFFELAHD